MKIYRTDTIGEYSNRENALESLKTYPDAKIWPIGNVRIFKGVSIPCKPSAWLVTIRREFSHDLDLSAKQIAKLLPTWAKPHFPRSIGDKVTAFYKANDKVVTGLHHSGFVVGSDEFHEWQETQPDCFRQTRDYLRGKYEHRI